MSLDNIQLSAETCSILFNHNLIGDLASNPEADSQNKIKINALGGNQKHVVFLVNDGSCKFLPDEEMELLTKLVSACKLTMNDISLVNFNSNPVNYHLLNEQFQYEKILIFGVSTSALELPFDIPNFQIQQFQQQLYLTAPPLKEFLNNVELKKELWQSLQKLFL